MALNRHFALAISALVIATASGCLGEHELLGEASQAYCVGTNCPGNSANIKGMLIDEMHRAGLQNNAGFQLLGVRRSTGAFMELDMQDGALYGVDTSQGSTQLYALNVDDELEVLHGPSGVVYKLRILGRAPMQTWWDVDEDFLAYRLGYVDPDAPPSPRPVYIDICAEPPVNDPAWAGLETYAVFFQGELYREETKSVVATGESATKWFNIACAGTALMKMFRMGYNPELEMGHPRYTTPLQRQATLKMITADYCGTGRSFTESGEEIVWHNVATWAPDLKSTSPNLPPAASAEAIWSDEGALCLDVARRHEHYGDPQELYELIADECGTHLPPCSQVDLQQWAGRIEWRTYNP